MVILRTGKRTWIIGQLLYLFLLSVGFTALVWLLSWAWYLPVLEWDTKWGNALLTASQGMGAVITSALSGIALIPQYFTIDPGIIKMTVWISPVSWMERTLMGNSAQNLPSYHFGIWMPLLFSLIISAALILTIGKCNVEANQQ